MIKKDKSLLQFKVLPVFAASIIAFSFSANAQDFGLDNQNSGQNINLSQTQDTQDTQTNSTNSVVNNSTNDAKNNIEEQNASVASEMEEDAIDSLTEPASEKTTLNQVDSSLKNLSEEKAQLALKRVKYEMRKMDIDLEKLKNEANAEKNSEEDREKDMEIQRLREQLQERNFQQQTNNPNQQTDGFRGVAVRSVYGVGDNIIAEVRFNDNKIIASKGTVFPNGSTVVDINSSGIVVRTDTGERKTYGVTGDLSNLANFNRYNSANNSSSRYNNSRY